MDHPDDIIICRCEEITRSEILDALRKGLTDMNDIKRATRAGMGLCQGKTCKKLLASLIAEFTGKDLADILPSTFRPPVRPVTLSHLNENPG
jgi:NAD(P)H-nitrite reductase large subunit